MPGSSRKTQPPKKSRDFRKEAGKPTLKKKAEPLSSESEDTSTDTEIESDLDIPVKDDTRRQRKGKGKQRPVASREKKQKQRTPAPAPEDTTDDEADEQLAKEADTKVAPHALLMLGSTYHIEFSPVTHPAHSFFIPWCGNFFSVLYFMCDALHSSTLVQETIPDFFSPALYWYGSMVWIIQILRSKDAAGVLTRAERQVYNAIIRTYPLEQWTLLSPMIGFMQSLGSVKVTDPMYTWIVPNFPSFQGFSAGHTYRGISNVPGIQRMPPILAYQQFVHAFGARTTNVSDGWLRPQESVTETAQFCGINAASDTAEDWQCLTNMYGWIAPPETGSLVTMTDMGLRQRKIQRWSVPAVPNTNTVTDLKSFIGLSDTEPITWYSRVLRMVAALEKFFPNSTTLANVEPTTAMSSIANVRLTRSPARVARDTWYHGRKGITLDITSPAGLDDSSKLRLSAASCYNAELDASLHAPIAQRIETGRSGPFFVNTTGEHSSVPLVQYESGQRSDPVLRFNEIIESHLFDRNGGR